MIPPALAEVGKLVLQAVLQELKHHADDHAHPPVPNHQRLHKGRKELFKYPPRFTPHCTPLQTGPRAEENHAPLTRTPFRNLNLEELQKHRKARPGSNSSRCTPHTPHPKAIRTLILLQEERFLLSLIGAQNDSCWRRRTPARQRNVTLERNEVT